MRLYRALLHLYPASFRAEYGAEMNRVFADRRRDTDGSLSRLALWLDVVVDTLRNALLVHWDILRQDLRYAARTLTRSPSFSATVIAVAGLGIGANVAVFTITDHVLIRPLPFPDGDRLVTLWARMPGYTRMESSPGNFRDWQSMNTTFESTAAYINRSVNMVGQGDPERLDGVAVTGNLLPMLGVQPALGRLFMPEDDRPGAAGTILLSDRLWQRQFGADAAVLGRTIRLDDQQFIVIGVLPRDCHFPRRNVAFWTTTRFGEQDFVERDNNYVYGIGKLKRGVTIDQARQELGVIAAGLERAFPTANAKTSATSNYLRDEISPQSRLLLAALAGAAICVLLITCTNLANLLLARALARQRELAVRTSLGAGRERLVRQLLTESLILACAGGLLGVFVANAALPLLTRLVPQTLPIAETPALDLRILAFSALLTIATGIGFGVIPAWRACGKPDLAGLREGARAGVGGRKERLRAALVIVEVMSSVVLLISAGLLIRALVRIQATDPGFRPDGVLTLRTTLPIPKYESAAQRQQFYRRVLSGTRELPGVSSAAFISFLPMVMRGGIFKVAVEGVKEPEASEQNASLRFVTPGFFSVMSIPLRLGRDVSEGDARDRPFVAVVSESFVRQYWPGEDPMGRRFQFGFQERTVVGVVGDIRVRGLERESEPQVYLSYQQVPDGGLPFYNPKDLVVRSQADPSALVPVLRRIIHSADHAQSISDVQPLNEVLDAETAPRRTQVRVLGAFAAVAVLLAAIGIHGLLSFAVSSRAQEIGVRIALGAQRSDILGMIVGEAMVLAAAGIVLGVIVAYGAGRSMQAVLAGVTPGDLLTSVTAVTVAFVMTTIGSLLPALRAIRLDPVTAIRAE